MNVEQRILSIAGHLIGENLTGLSVLRRGERTLVLQARSRNASGRGEVIIKAVTGRENLLLNERAALRFVHTGAVTRSCAPRVLGSTPDAGILVMEHVPGETLETVLASADAEKAERSVMATAHALGMLHAATAGRQGEWAACAGASRKPPAEQGEEFRELAPAIVRFFERVGIGVPPAVREQLGAVARTLERAAEWLAFTVGDLAPSNVILSAAGPVFVDFEYADFRHACYDAAFWHSICPFPANVAERADRAYHAGWTEAGTGEGAVGADEKILLEQTALLAAHRAFWSLTWGTAQLWDSDFHEMPGVSARRLRRLWLRGFVRVAERAGVLPVLAAAAQDLDAALGRRWPETTTPAVLFPAFGALA